jgi:hypothetical protein
MIATPGGKIATNQLNCSIPIPLGSKVCKTTLLILWMDNVDIILGTDWMTHHQVVLDVANRIVEVHSQTLENLPCICLAKKPLSRVPFP